MNEIILNTAICLTKKDIIKCGAVSSLETCLEVLAFHSKDKFVDLIAEDLKDDNNAYQFILTINKLEV